MGAVASKSVADLRRRRLQSTVLAIVLFLGAGGATLALSILVETNEPFDRAFAAANGAHLVVDYDPAVTDAQLAATTTASGVTASAGPWPVAGFALRGKEGVFGGLLASGRPTPTDTIDRVTILAGRWWAAPGEIVLDQDTATLLDVGLGASVPLLPDPNPDKRFARTPSGGGGTPVLPAPGASAAPHHARQGRDRDRRRHRRVGQHAGRRRLAQSERHPDPRGSRMRHPTGRCCTGWIRPRARPTSRQPSPGSPTASRRMTWSARSPISRPSRMSNRSPSCTCRSSSPSRSSRFSPRHSPSPTSSVGSS